MTSLERGSRIGPYPYTVVKKLSNHQGFSNTYLATIQGAQDGPFVVLKVVDTSQPEPQKNALREAALANEVERLRTLNHPGVIRILPVETDLNLPNKVYSARTSLPGEPWFYVMEYLAGGSLADLLKSGHDLDTSLVLEISSRLAATIAYLHSGAIVHLDLKPENVMFRRPLQTGLLSDPVLIDFGVSRSVSELGSLALTLDYAPPERTRLYRDKSLRRLGDKAETSMDVYSLGVIIYEMLTKRRPDDSKSWIAVFNVPSSDQAAPPSRYRRELDPEIDRIVLRCIDSNPTERPSASELGQQLTKARYRLESEAHPSALLAIVRMPPNNLFGRYAIAFVMIAILVMILLFILTLPPVSP